MTNSKLRRIFPWLAVVGALAILLTALLLEAFPPATGYYYSSAFEILDGSQGYLHLHDGLVEAININGQHGDSRRQVGTYEINGRRLTVSFIHGTPKILTANVSLFGLRWTTDIVTGSSRHNYCPRLFMPSILKRLEKVSEAPNR